MKRTIRHTAIATTVALILLIQLVQLIPVTDAVAQVPATFSVTSVLRDSDGERLEGNFVLSFRLYEADEGTTALWEESQGFAIEKGIVQATLGLEEPLELPFDTTYWLGISVNSGDELEPRIALTASPYSVISKYVGDEALVAGANVTVTRNDSNQVVISAAGPGEPMVGNTLNAAGGTPKSVVYVDSAGLVGVNSLNPEEALSVGGVVQSLSGGFKFPDGTVQSSAASEGTPHPWLNSGSNLYFNTGKVGIGDNSPVATLTVGNGDKLQIHGADGDVVFKDDQGSLRFANSNGANQPMIQMFQSGTNNNTRMLVAHSPSFPTWGIQYNDTTDTFNWIGDNLPVFNVQLSGQQRIGVGTFKPEAKVHVVTNSATGFGHLKLTETQFDYSRITFNNTTRNNFWDIAVRTDTNKANAQINFYHSDVGDIFSVNARGRVGINDASAAWPLEINGNGQSRTINVYNTLPTTTTSSFNYGVIANLSQAGNTGFPRLFNIYGFSSDSDSYLSYGVYGFASNASNFNYGVYGVASTTKGYAGYFSGNVFTTGLYQSSDAKLKYDIQTLQGGLDKVMALRPRTSRYDTQTYKAMNLPEGEQFGFLAEDVKAVMPELVKTSFQPYDEPTSDTPEGQGIEFEAVNYVGMIPVLVSAIQEQQATITALQAELKALRAAVER
ncbi:MAG: tail fiber domain-containing protein [Rhodothermia bacterium]